ncbi:type II toxin-antitoxin system VapC family toxin [Mucilaginibacter pedocola]|uniref:type II toxin-antitoxin system VapC family toxin n=1 Tax=Mucilaginibacter pedocola TaxID=1792845 RepID=UPI00099361EB|nr:type II toxin-antitoxin system VapC family toxin [Mucilaginibacter pedocola]
MIDTNVVIGYLDNKLPAEAMVMLNDVVDDVSNLSVVSKIEILRFNATPGAYKVLEDFIGESNVIGLTEAVVERTILVCKAHRIKLPDAIIAATALTLDYTLLTRNISDFKNI